MSGDGRHERLKFEAASRTVVPQREARSSPAPEGAEEGEFEMPTRPDGRMIDESEAPTNARAAGNVQLPRVIQEPFDPDGRMIDESEAPTKARAPGNGPSAGPDDPDGRTIDESEAPTKARPPRNAPLPRVTQDSLNPVRVAPRSVRPPLSLWKLAWATAALVVVAGGAVGIVASLRMRLPGAGRREAQSDSSRGVVAPPRAPARGMEVVEVSTRMATPAAGFSAPSPVAPVQTANCSAAPAVSATAAPSAAPATVSIPARASPSAVPYRTPESLAVSQRVPNAVPLPARRPKPTEPGVRSAVAPPSSEESAPPTAAPSKSDVSETKGESEAWVTEERRF